MTREDPGFEDRLSALLAAGHDDASAVEAAVGGIIADVRARGDRAVIDWTARFDRLTLEPGSFAIAPDEVDAGCAAVAPEDRRALELAAERIRDFHLRQRPEDARWSDGAGAALGWRWTAVGAAGLYVPGGTASYPSSVLMNAIPAQVAGVERLVIASPARGGVVNPLVLLAARLAGVETIYRIGGAQAIAALAYGTETIAPVDKITGPGNAYVAAAKRQVHGQVGIDSIAGPSEILVIADGSANPAWVALDLLAQAEHDAVARAILVTDSAALARAVAAEVEAALAGLARREIAGASWRDHGAIILVRDMAEAAAIAERFAPEHLHIQTADPEAVAARIRHAGAIFLGAWTPEAMGDYVAGPNHVLPTARTARFSSGLSVLDFMKRTTITRLGPEAMRAIGPAAARLADSEGLGAHAASVRARLAALNGEG
jgi:histidinol dehydrogenase